MEARLVLIQSGRPGQVFELRGTELVIGRDPGVDLFVEAARVSRRHAVVRTLGDRHSLSDLGSSNGTTVNGAPVTETVVLRPGDRVELAGEVTLVYEEGAEPSRRPVAMLALAALLVVVGVGGFLLWRDLDGSEELDPGAVSLASEGYRAYRTGDAHTAKVQLLRARQALIDSGQVDDVPRMERPKVALERLGGGLEGKPDLLSVFQSVLEATRPRPEPAHAQKVGCRLDRVATRDFQACLRERIELVMAALWQDPADVPDDFHKEVGARLLRENTFLRKSLARGRPLIPRLRKAFEEQKMPPLLHYLACIESGYNPDAVSPAKAMGLWQFMPATARQYGLKVDGARDERRDVDKSTRAAVKYLKGLAFEFGGDALLLALAGYNRGENGVRRALKRMDDPFADRSYWRLVEEGLLPKETALYVPRFMAAAVAGEAGLPDPDALEAAGY